MSAYGTYKKGNNSAITTFVMGHLHVLHLIAKYRAKIAIISSNMDTVIILIYIVLLLGFTGLYEFL